MRISAANIYSALYGMNRLGALGRSSTRYGGSGMAAVSYPKAYASGGSGLQANAAEFRRIAEKLQDTDWEKSYRLSGKKDLLNQVRSFAEEYNNLLTQAKTLPYSSTSTYGAQFKKLAEENREELKAIGIGINQDGTLAVDSRRLKQAKAADFQKVFAGTESLAGKAAVKSIYAQAGSYGTYGYGNYGYGVYGYGSYGLSGLYGGYPYTGRYFDMLL